MGQTILCTQSHDMVGQNLATTEAYCVFTMVRHLSHAQMYPYLRFWRTSPYITFWSTLWTQCRAAMSCHLAVEAHRYSYLPHYQKVAGSWSIATRPLISGLISGADGDMGSDLMARSGLGGSSFRTTDSTQCPYEYSSAACGEGLRVCSR